MEAGSNLQNFEPSLNFEVPTLSGLHAGKEEEEEAAEDERVKTKELQDLLNGAFDDLNIEDDDDDFNSASASMLSNRNFNENENILQCNNWSHGTNWFNKFASSSSRQTDTTNGNHELLENVSMERQINCPDSVESLSRHQVDEKQTENYSGEYPFSPCEDNRDPNASGDSSIPGSNGSWPEMGDHKEQMSESSFTSPPRNGMNGHSEHSFNEVATPKADTTGGLNPDALPFSSYGLTQANIELQAYSKPLETSDYYHMQYSCRGGGTRITDWQNGLLECQNEKGNASRQNQFISTGPDTAAQDLIQLRILCSARGRDLAKMQTELEQEKEDNCVKIDSLQQEMELLKSENEELIATLNERHQALESFKTLSAKQEGTVAALESLVKSQESSKIEVMKKLKIAEATIETLTHHVNELEKADAISHARNQHELVISGMQQRHSEELQNIREQLDLFRNQLQEKTEEVSRLQEQFNNLTRIHEQTQLERVESVNRLTKNLEESQRQCQELLRSGSVKQSLQQSVDSGFDSQTSEKIITSLQEEVAILKEELDLYENASHLGLFGDSSPGFNGSNTSVNDTIAALHVKKNSTWKTPKALRSSNSNGNCDLISNLKVELDRCLSSNRSKRSKLTKLQADHRNTLREVDLLKTQISGVEKQNSDQQLKIADQQTKLAELEPLSKEKHLVRLHDVEKLRMARDELVEELEETQQRVSELLENENRLNDVVRHLQQQMSQLVQENNEDRRQALERCQQTYLQLHEDSIKKIRKEMGQLHGEELKKVQKELQQTLKEVDSVKSMYVKVCQEKTEVESKFEDIGKHYEEMEKAEIQLQHNKSVALLKEKHLHLIKSLHNENKLSTLKDSNEQDKQQVTTLKSQVSKLDGELKLHQAKVRELETITTIKNEQLEALRKEQNLGMKHVEVQVQTILQELQTKLQEKEDEILKLKQHSEMEIKALQTCLTEARKREESSFNNSEDVKKIKEQESRLLQMQVKEDDLFGKVHELEETLEEKSKQLQFLTSKATKDIATLRSEFEKAVREKDTSVASLQASCKEQGESLQIALQEKTHLKAKLRHCHKFAQSRELHHQGTVAKLQSEHGVLIKELGSQLEELKKASTVTTETSLQEINKMHSAQMKTLKDQYSSELSAVHHQYSQELETVKGLVQHYQDMYKQLQVDAENDSLLEIQESIKQVMNALQRDLFQYLSGLNKRVAQRIHKEVLRERKTIIARLREQFGMKDSQEFELSVLHRSNGSRSQVETQFHTSSSNPSNMEKGHGNGVVNVGTTTSWTGMSQRVKKSGDGKQKNSSSKGDFQKDIGEVLDFKSKASPAEKLLRLLQHINLQSGTANSGSSSDCEKMSPDVKTIPLQKSGTLPELHGDSVEAKELVNSVRPAFSVDHLHVSPRRVLSGINFTEHLGGYLRSESLLSTSKADPLLKSAANVSGPSREQPIGQSASETTVSKTPKPGVRAGRNKSSPRSNRTSITNSLGSMQAFARQQGDDLEEMLGEFKLPIKCSKAFNIDKGIQQVIESNPAILNTLLHSLQNNLQQQSYFKRMYEHRNTGSSDALTQTMKIGDSAAAHSSLKTFAPLETESDSSTAGDHSAGNETKDSQSTKKQDGNGSSKRNGRQWVQKQSNVSITK